MINKYSILFLLFFCVSCEFVDTKTDSEVEKTSELVLTGPVWQLNSFKNASGRSTPINYDSIYSGYTEEAYTVVFTEQAADSLRSDKCSENARTMKVLGYPNEGFFVYETTSSDLLSVCFYGATQINQLSGSKEARFFTALDAAHSYHISGNELRIDYGEGKELLFNAKSSSN